MNQFEKATQKSDDQFLRDVGVGKETFEVIFNLVASHIQSRRDEQPMKKRGQKSELRLVERLLLTFTYLRHYPTFARLGDEFGISESYANKIYHQILDVLVKVLPMKSRKHLLDSDLETIAIDVTEQPIERPTMRQRLYYSGKQKLHTIKVQLIICLATLEILSVVCRKGKVHDYRIFKESRLAIAPEIEKLADSGYQGIAKLYANSYTPIKKTRNKPLTRGARKFNRELASRRIPIEHVNRWCKIFRIAKETYRGKHRNYGKTWNVIAAIVNLRYSTEICQPAYPLGACET